MTNIIEATPMAHKLRKYQKEAVDRVINGDGKNQMIQLPAGAGKTVVAGKICNHYLKEGKKILFLVHRKELAKQAKAEFMQKYEIDSSFIIANHRQDLSANMQIASVQTYIRRKNFNPDIIFIDEAHHALASTYRDIIATYPNARLLGLTATPYRLSLKGFTLMGLDG